MAASSSVILASAGYDHTIRFWEATTGICYRTLQYNDSAVNTLQIAADKSLLAAGGNPNIRLYEVNSNNAQPIVTYDGHTSNVTSLGFEKNGTWMYSSSEDGSVKIWDLRAPGPQREFEHKASVNHVVLHPFNQHELISGDQLGNIRVWDLRVGACSCELVPEVGVPVRSLTIAPDGSLVVAANNNGTCYVWKTIQGVQTSQFEPLHKLKAHNAYILKCLLSPDCRMLATTSSDRTVKLWNLDSFTLERTLVGHQRWVWDAVFSVDAAYLVTASSDATARLWDLSTGESIRIYQGHHKAICCCALNDSAL